MVFISQASVGFTVRSSLPLLRKRASGQEPKPLRKKKKTACDIIEDHPKLRELLESEFEARLENDPYLSEREKSALRQQNAPAREENHYER